MKLQPKYRRGFTLVEVLTVAAILGILAALLFPVFSRIRESARRSTCQSNQRQVLAAVFLYAQDYDGSLPFQWVAAGTPRQDPSWHQQIVQFTKSQQVFRCPTDPGTRIFTDYTTRLPNFHTSYAINKALYRRQGSGQPILLGQVMRSSSTVLLTDAGTRVSYDPPHVTVNSPVKDGCTELGLIGESTVSSAPQFDFYCGPNLRHSGTSNVAFVDGHVKAMRIEEWYYDRSPWMRIDLDLIGR